MLRKIVIALVVLAIGIQLIPVWLLQNNPPVVSQAPWPNAQARALAQRACYDCHSNETVWPLYSRIAPVSWLVTFDVLNGRRRLNFSDWNAPRRREREDDLARVVQNGDMPPSNYLLLHPEGQLSSTEKEQLIQALQALPR